ncbi:hypothetical protein V8G54_013356, partial [Vigna mungo]
TRSRGFSERFSRKTFWCYHLLYSSIFTLPHSTHFGVQRGGNKYHRFPTQAAKSRHCSTHLHCYWQKCCVKREIKKKRERAPPLWIFHLDKVSGLLFFPSKVLA